jgi:hypothetical protein
MIDAPKRPALFEESNREIWLIVRRFMIYILYQIDRWYGTKTIKK